MKMKDILASYLRSALNIGVGAVSIVFALATVIWGGAPVPLAFGGAVLVYGIVSSLLLLSRRGAKSVVKEQDYLHFLKVSEKIQEASDVRDRISFLRISDTEVAQAVQYFLLVSGQYLDTCRRERTYDPVAHEAMNGVLTVLQALLNEYDEASTEKRFNLPDENPFPDAKARCISAIRDASAVIKERRISIGGGMTGDDVLSSREELPR